MGNLKLKLTPEQLANLFYSQYSGYTDEEKILLEEGFATAIDFFGINTADVEINIEEDE